MNKERMIEILNKASDLCVRDADDREEFGLYEEQQKDLRKLANDLDAIALFIEKIWGISSIRNKQGRILCPSYERTRFDISMSGTHNVLNSVMKGGHINPAP